MKLRKAVIGDLKEIQKLNLMLFEKEKGEYDNFLDLNWTFGEKGTGSFKKHLTNDDFCVFIVENSGEIIGYLAGGISKAESYRIIPWKIAELNNMFVLKEYRRRGVGKMLNDAFVYWCKDKGFKMLKVQASANNKQAINFYRKNGYKDYTLVLESFL